VPVGHVQPAAQLRDLRRRRVLRGDGGRLFRLRQRRPEIPRPVRAPGYPWLPGLYVVLTGLIAVDLLVQEATRTYAMLGLALVLLGVPVYFAWRRLATR